MITWSIKDLIFNGVQLWIIKALEISRIQFKTLNKSKNLQTGGDCLFAAVLCEQGCCGGFGFCVLQWTGRCVSCVVLILGTHALYFPCWELGNDKPEVTCLPTPNNTASHTQALFTFSACFRKRKCFLEVNKIILRWSEGEPGTCNSL